VWWWSGAQAARHVVEGNQAGNVMGAAVTAIFRGSGPARHSALLAASTRHQRVFNRVDRTRNQALKPLHLW
jgi:hypothetical protein